MEKENLTESNYIQEILDLIRGGLSDQELRDRLDDYHENDIAEALEQLSPPEQKALLSHLETERVSEILTYVEDPKAIIEELDLKDLAEIVSEMDSDEAVEFLEDIDDETRGNLHEILDKETAAGIDLIRSYDDDEIGSEITTNYILIENTLTIRQAMRSLIKQAEDKDNISTIYVKDQQGKFYGAIDLKDLIIAREHEDLEDLIATGYPTFNDHEKISDCIERIKDYAEDSLPVLNKDREMIGIITAQTLIEVVDDELGEDYAKFAGLTAEEDLKEKTKDSVKKRLPWLIILLILGMGVSSLVGVFEGVVVVIPVIISFQSLILDMSGNIGTQSLAVTIRVLMDENLRPSDKFKLVIKEIRVGFVNGLILGAAAFGIIGVYLGVFRHYEPSAALLVSGCVGISLVVAMVISSFMGTIIPLFFHRIKVDPAVASGPLITTVNDLVAVLTYYGLAWILLVQVFQIS